MANEHEKNSYTSKFNSQRRLKNVKVTKKTYHQYDLNAFQTSRLHLQSTDRRLQMKSTAIS